jgi:CRP/FNR family transcriptional regulator
MGEIKRGETIGPVACRACDLFEVCSAIDAIPAAHGLPRCPTLRVVEAGAVIYSAGTPAQHVYALRKGLMKSEHTDDAGKRVVDLHVPGEVMGGEGIHEGRYTGTVRAMTDVMFCELPFQDLARWPSPSLQTELAALGHLKRSSVIRGSKRARDRLNSFAQDLVSRLRSHGISSPEIAIDMRRYELAEMLDVGIDALRRALEHQESRKVELRGRHLIVRA